MSWLFGIRLHAPPDSRASGLTGDREAIAVQQPCIEQHLHERLDAADLDQLGHHVRAARPQIREHRHALADAREVVERQLDASPSCAIASRCSTAFVEPPSAITTVIAFSKASRVRMSRRLDAALEQLHDRLARAPAVVALRRSTPLPAPSCSAGSCRALRSPKPSCWPCTCRRSYPGPGIAVRSTSLAARVADLARAHARRRPRTRR